MIIQNNVILILVLMKANLQKNIINNRIHLQFYKKNKIKIIVIILIQVI